MRIRPVIRGLIGYIPGILDLLKNRNEHTGTVSADYCYSVWLRHFYLLHKHGLKDFKTVAEIGPGASLGIGLSSILSGANNYFAFDLIEHTAVEDNLRIFNDLVELFSSHCDIPSEKRFPKVKPILDSYSFQELGLTDYLLNKNIDPKRIEAIQQAIKNMNSNTTAGAINIKYKAPWFNSVIDNPVDLIISQAVFEHFDDPEPTIQKMATFLKKGGVMSHVIDYSAHETHEIWNGHWSYPQFIWRIIAKGRSYPLNRKPHSYYLNLFRKYNLNIIYMQPNFRNDGIEFEKIPAGISEEYKVSDMGIAGCYFILKKD